MKFSIKDFFSKCDHIRSFLRIWSHLLKKSLMENFIFCAVCTVVNDVLYNLGKIRIEFLKKYGQSTHSFHHARIFHKFWKDLKVCVSVYRSTSVFVILFISFINWYYLRYFLTLWENAFIQAFVKVLGGD